MAESKMLSPTSLAENRSVTGLFWFCIAKAEISIDSERQPVVHTVQSFPAKGTIYLNEHKWVNLSERHRCWASWAKAAQTVAVRIPQNCRKRIIEAYSDFMVERPVYLLKKK